MISRRLHYLPRDFSSTFFVAVYLPHQTNAGIKTSLSKLFTAISKQENAHPGTGLLVAGDFNACTFKYILPNFYKLVTCAIIRKRNSRPSILHT
jgi:hypothetical protein